MKKHLYNRDAFSLVGLCGLEPQTSSLSVTRSNQLSYSPGLLMIEVYGGDTGTRTPDPLLAKQVL
jgi:hypothetical protein